MCPGYLHMSSQQNIALMWSSYSVDLPLVLMLWLIFVDPTVRALDMCLNLIEMRESFLPYLSSWETLCTLSVFDSVLYICWIPRLPGAVQLLREVCRRQRSFSSSPYLNHHTQLHRLMWLHIKELTVIEFSVIQTTEQRPQKQLNLQTTAPSAGSLQWKKTLPRLWLLGNFLEYILRSSFNY